MFSDNNFSIFEVSIFKIFAFPKLLSVNIPMSCPIKGSAFTLLDWSSDVNTIELIISPQLISLSKYSGLFFLKFSETSDNNSSVEYGSFFLPIADITTTVLFPL